MWILFKIFEQILRVAHHPQSLMIWPKIGYFLLKLYVKLMHPAVNFYALLSRLRLKLSGWSSIILLRVYQIIRIFCKAVGFCEKYCKTGITHNMYISWFFYMKHLVHCNYRGRKEGGARPCDTLVAGSVKKDETCEQTRIIHDERASTNARKPRDSRSWRSHTPHTNPAPSRLL